MSLQPSLSFLRIGDPTAPHALELYLDFTCPFSAKIFFKAIDPILKPAFTTGNYTGKVKLILRLQPQPWQVQVQVMHATATFMSEAALAVGRVAPEHFYAYVTRLFENQEQFFDIPVSNLTPIQIREKLVSLAPEGVDKAAVSELLKHKTTPNGGVAVTDDLKYNVKLGRQNGIHVTPSAVWDGLFMSDVSSSWAQEEWSKFLQAKVTV